MDFDPVLLRAFIAVHETGGFTRAARRLHLTQSAVSHQIRRLEEQVGRALLYRTTRAMTLTEEGHDFLLYARQVLEAMDALSRRFQPSSLTGIVRFGVPETFMGERLPPMLCQFARAFPCVRLDVNVGTYLDLRAMIKAGELDLAVVLAEPGKRNAETVLRKTRFVWVAADNFRITPGTSLPLVLPPATCIDRQTGIRALDRAAIEWHVTFTSPSPEGIRTAVLAGLGVTAQIQGDLRPGMKILDQQHGLPVLPEMEFVLIWSKGDKSAAVREFGKLLMDMPEPAGNAASGRKRSSSALR